MKMWALPLFLLAACGGNPPGTNSDAVVGTQRSLSLINIESDDRAQLSTICNALGQKALALNNTTADTYIFTVSQKSCIQATAPAAFDESVYIKQAGNHYYFKRVLDNRDFIFSELQTPNSGLVGELCSKLSSTTNPITNPVVLSSGKAVWFTTKVNSTDCSPTPQSLCLSVETGSPNGNTYKITDRDFFRFQVDPTLPRIGFFLQRTNISTGLCAVNQTTEVRALLKNL